MGWTWSGVWIFVACYLGDGLLLYNFFLGGGGGGGGGWLSLKFLGDKVYLNFF